MFQRHPTLLFLLPPSVGVMFWLVMDGILGNEHGSWAGVGLLIVCGGMLSLMGVVSRLKVNLEIAHYDRRLEPVQQTVDACWLMPEKKEVEYRHRLVRQLLRSLDVVAKPEAPLPTGTRVDAYMEFGDEDWYITIKRGLKKNQQRLILQGEIEDIILHAPHHDRDLWICVVVGLSEEDDANELAHFKALCEYAAQRSISTIANHLFQPEGGSRPINIEVMYAIIPSTPLTSDELRELEFAPV
jgi:hypothetical protein